MRTSDGEDNDDNHSDGNNNEDNSDLFYNSRILSKQVKSPTDASNFDDYPKEDDIPPDDLSGWDKDF